MRPLGTESSRNTNFLRSYLDEIEQNQKSVVGLSVRDLPVPQLSPRPTTAPRIFRDDSFFSSHEPSQQEQSISLIRLVVESQIGIRQFGEEESKTVYMFTLRIGEITLKTWLSNQDGGEQGWDNEQERSAPMDVKSLLAASSA